METTACYAERRERRQRKPSIGHVQTLRSKGSKGPIKDRSIELNEVNGVILRSTFDQTFVRALPNPSIDEIEGFEDVRGVPRRARPSLTKLTQLMGPMRGRNPLDSPT
jgi:hypothetical protein